jgi:cytochrome oxidase Cu insertion factor (SCO1/SenC/PrrC family)
MEIQQSVDREQQRRGRLMLLVLAIFFTVPILVVVLMLHFNWRPAGQSHGELVAPPRMIVGNDMLADSSGKPVGTFWLDKWSMVYITDNCQDTCLSRLHDMRQLQVSLYKDMPRVQRVLITTVSGIASIKSTYPDMRIINQPAGIIGSTVAQFNIGQEDAMQTGRLYLIDPLGYIMMSYPASAKAADIRKDLVRLLKSSWAG